MQALVDSKLMEATWKTLGASSVDKIRRLQKQYGKAQQELTNFVIGFSSDLGPDALGLALYMHLAVWQAFERSGVKFRKVKAAKIMQAWNLNFAVVNQLKAAGFGRSHFTFPSELTSEPAVLQYIVDALTEQDESDPISMTDEEFWRILQVLKTYCDCLHDAGTSA